MCVDKIVLFSRQTLQLRLKMEEECLGVNKLHDSVETLSKVPLNFTRNLKLLSTQSSPSHQDVKEIYSLYSYFC